MPSNDVKYCLVTELETLKLLTTAIVNDLESSYHFTNTS